MHLAAMVAVCVLVVGGSGYILYCFLVTRHASIVAERAKAAESAMVIGRASAALYGSEYLAQSDVEAWKAAHPDAVTLAGRRTFVRHLPEELRVEIERLCDRLADLPQSVREHNRAFIRTRLREESASFDRVERYPLTERQRQAIVTDEDTTLVVAGAGTGKTSTIAGKVAYLLRRDLARPNEILVLAYAKKASEELSERLAALSGTDTPRASTFHALGYEIIGRVEGRKPNLSRLAEDERQIYTFIDQRVRGMLAHPDQRGPLVDFFTEMLDERPPGRDALTGDEYIRAQRRSGLRAFDGTLLKSREEVRIANWLILNGVAWEYERPYPVGTATPMHRPYKPDFYLPEYDLYLEHFGIDGEGNTRPGIDRDAYIAAMAWKRALHRAQGTRLVETFSHFDDDGGLIARLAALLQREGVAPSPLTEDEIDAIIAKADRPYSDFVRLLTQFLNLCKGNDHTPDLVSRRAGSDRDRVFLTIFERVRVAYEAELVRTQSIDFNDMINRAREHVRANRFIGSYRYILVDEFQDISENRLGLLRDLRAHVPHSRLFVVGDDWQAIFRFAGSDVGIIANLAAHVGATERVNLDTTFRYPQGLLDLSSKFVTRNPAQLRKTLHAREGRAGSTPVCIIYEQRSVEGSGPALRTALADIDAHLRASGESRTPVSVYILGRYNFNKPADMASLERQYKRDGIEVEFLTVHRSKGKEADFVIVVGLEDGEYGFPSSVSDDPVTRMVLSEPEAFAHAEERRLFYVALTRARRRVYLVAPPDRVSTFVQDDILGTALRDHVEVIGEESKRFLCPVCAGKTIRRTHGAHGTFWACANYPLCNGRLDACPACQDGGLARESQTATLYNCTDCDFEADVCPECGHGYLKRKVGRYGPFLGCSRWNSSTGCTYTRNTTMHAIR